MSATQEWLKFAKDDLRSAEILLTAEIFNMVCFHCQQAVEKSLKAFLRRHEGTIPYIHMLEELCERCAAINPSFFQFADDCRKLDIYYQPTRYPEAPAGALPEGMPNKQQAEEALEKAKNVFEFVQQELLTPPASSG